MEVLKKRETWPMKKQCSKCNSLLLVNLWDLCIDEKFQSIDIDNDDYYLSCYCPVCNSEVKINKKEITKDIVEHVLFMNERRKIRKRTPLYRSIF